MKKALIGLCAAAATLAFAGSALASYSPKLVVSATGTAAGGPTRVGVVVNASDDPTAKVTMYVPAGYTVGTPAPGTKLGDVTATAAAADLGGAVLPLTGELDAVPASSTTTAAAQSCGVSPSQTWDLHLSAAGQTLDIPVFVVSSPAALAPVYPTQIVVCLPPPDVPVGTPGRSVFGAKLLSATFSSSALTEPTSAGDYRWTSTWTPYTPNTGRPNAAGTVEAQSIRHLPVTFGFATAKRRVVVGRTVKVHGKKVRRKTVVTVVGFATRITENGKAPASAVVSVTSRGKRLGGAKGAFTMTGIKSTRVNVTAVVDSDTGAVPTGTPTKTTDLFFHDLGSTGCTPTALFGGISCVDATVGGERFTRSVVVTAYRK
jgi:hypothetical protein